MQIEKLTPRQISDIVVGKTLPEAEQLIVDTGYECQYGQIDDKNYVTTCDVRGDRIALFVKNNIVVRAEVG